MSGIAALAAAAAATQKITTTASLATAGTPTSGVRVVTPTMVSAAPGMKVTPMAGRTGQTVRMGKQKLVCYSSTLSIALFNHQISLLSRIRHC